MSEYRLRVAEAIVAARESVDVSQRELADRLGRDKRTIQKWEKGEMKIALEDFLEIFEALKVQVEPYSKWVRHRNFSPTDWRTSVDLPRTKSAAPWPTFYKCQASPLEVEQEYYFLFADHGSGLPRYVPAVDGQSDGPAAGTAGASVPKSLTTIPKRRLPARSPTPMHLSQTWKC